MRSLAVAPARNRTVVAACMAQIHCMFAGTLQAGRLLQPTPATVCAQLILALRIDLFGAAQSQGSGNQHAGGNEAKHQARTANMERTHAREGPCAHCLLALRPNRNVRLRANMQQLLHGVRRTW